MKSLMTILLALSLCALAAPAQTPSDTSGKRSDTSGTGGQRQKRMGQKFIDRNGDGIDDRLAGQGMRRGKDRFIDADGDGICDERASGLGFRHGAGTGGGYMGGDSKGKGKHQGGKP
jgi:hypothetical protein